MKLLACLSLVSLAIGATDINHANAQGTPPAAKVAVVDVIKVLNESEPWKKAREEIKARTDEVQNDLNTRGKDIKARSEELDRQKAILAPDVFQTRRGELAKEMQSLQREAQISNNKLNNVLNEIRLRLRGVIVQIAAKVSTERGMNIGFDRADVIYFGDQMDITDEVLKRFNASDTKIEITVDKQ
ncbi:OmpH family outer membrane protein [Sneathiella chinensis]|nr:OmpH family outer membrane protein [Sneathiella chinensis]